MNFEFTLNWPLQPRAYVNPETIEGKRTRISFMGEDLQALIKSARYNKETHSLEVVLKV